MKYTINQTNLFKKELKKIRKQNKDLRKLEYIVNTLADNITLDQKYKDHPLVDDKHFKNCRECHIEPDWLLIYQYQNDKLILLLIETGSHSELFN